MTRYLRVGSHALVVVSYLASILLLDSITGDGNAQAVIGIGVSVLVGLIIGRWWVLGVPMTGALLVVIYGIGVRLFGSHQGDLTFFAEVFLTLSLALLGAAALALGVKLRQISQRMRRSNQAKLAR